MIMCRSSLIRPHYISHCPSWLHISIGSQGRLVWKDKVVGRWNPVLVPLTNYRVRPNRSTQAAFEVKNINERYASRSLCRSGI